MTRPAVEFVAGVVVMVFGAWLIGWWAVGIVLIIVGLCVAADAVMRDDAPRKSKQQLSDGVLERWRQAR